MSSTVEAVGDILEVHGVVRIEWNIRNYSKLSAGKNETFKFNSPSFEILGATWKLVLYPAKQITRKNYNLRWVSIFLEKQRSEFKDHFVYCNFEMKTVDRVMHSFSLEKCFQENDLYGSEECLRSDFLYLKPDETVTLLLYIYPTNSTIKDVISYLDSTNMTFEGIGILSTDMEDLRLKQQDSDLIIRVKTREFKVHKSILAARSSVFNSMLHSDMAEKNTGIVDIVEFEPDIFENFLRYLYTGRVDHLSWTNVAEMYVLGDKYDIQYLKKECRKYMKDKICFDTFFDVLLFAIKHDEQILLKCAKEFFVKNIDTILPSQQWREFMKENLSVCNDLFINYASIFSLKKQ